MEKTKAALRRRAAAAALALLLMLAGCARTKGSETAYDGFTVRTERERAADAPEAGAVPARAMPGEAEAEEDYVLNRNSGKFHYPSCPSAGEIKEANRWDFHGTRETVIELGYEPCKSCNP